MMKKHYNLIKCGQKENTTKIHSFMFHIVCVFLFFKPGKMGLLFFLLNRDWSQNDSG